MIFSVELRSTPASIDPAFAREGNGSHAASSSAPPPAPPKAPKPKAAPKAKTASQEAKTVLWLNKTTHCWF